jgi:hypothetical protein
MRRPAPTSRPICWLAILALIAHAWLPLLHALRPATGTRVMLCSALAPGQWVFIPDDTLPEGAPDKALQASCPLCLAGAHFALAPPVHDHLARLSNRASVQVPRLHTHEVSRTDWPDFHSRAPPVA